jgi:hypothetical protein
MALRLYLRPLGKARLFKPRWFLLRAMIAVRPIFEAK